MIIQFIRIVPEWNVKVWFEFHSWKIDTIRIVPEWNVKVTQLKPSVVPGGLESYQSGM